MIRSKKVHAGQERNGTMIRETLKEATQSERLQKRKNQINSFFKPKSTLPEEQTPPPEIESKAHNGDQLFFVQQFFVTEKF